MTGFDEDDFGDAETCDPAARWWKAPLLYRQDMLAAIERSKRLDGWSANLFRTVLERPPRSDLLETYLCPALYVPDSHYIYCTPDPNIFKYADWRPEMTAAAIEHRCVPLPCGVFSNPLAWPNGSQPRHRTYNAGFAIYTVEFDGALSLIDQIKLIGSGKLKIIDTEFRRYCDYRGYEVVYSGGKSLHFHFVFDIRHLKHDLAIAGNTSYRDRWSQDLPDCLLRPAYAICWDRLMSLFCDITGTDAKPDTRLKSWEQLRRCPWAWRLVGAGNPLGLPAGHRVQQPVLASRIAKNAPRDAIEWFHDPGKLCDLAREEKVRHHRSRTFGSPAVSASEMEAFDRHAAEIFKQIIGAEYPRYAGYEVTDDGFRCRFYNSPTDRNPRSICDGNRDRILLQGQHDFPDDGVPIAATPNRIFHWIVSRPDVATTTSSSAPPDWIMRQYKACVDDRASLRRFLENHIAEIIDGGKPFNLVNKLMGASGCRVLIRAPQGCGKSTIVMTSIPALHDSDPGPIFVSSPSIAQAEEKAETFGRIHPASQFVPFLYLSLTALYERFCSLPDRIGHLDVLEDGDASWLRAIYERQPDVYRQMFAYRRQLFDLIEAGKIPVLFGTHETLRQHADRGMTRVFYARDFNECWFGVMSPADRKRLRANLFNQNKLHRVIVDEVTAQDLVTIHTAEMVEWAWRCAREIELDEADNIVEIYAKFAEYLSIEACKGMTWNTFRHILHCQYTDEHLVLTAGQEVPFDEKEGIYAEMVGKSYYVRPRGWWNDFWHATLLTTEALPTRIIEAIDFEAAKRGEACDDRFRVYDFELPQSSRDTVTMHLHRACKRQTLGDLVRAYRQAYPQAEIISNMVKARITDFSVTTHASAKGSNAFIGENIVAFYNAPAPSLFGELGALNTRFGRSDFVSLFYVDQFDQTCGRNRGFRAHHNTDHIAVFPPGLYRWLAPAMCWANYVPVLARSLQC